MIETLKLKLIRIISRISIFTPSQHETASEVGEEVSDASTTINITFSSSCSTPPDAGSRARGERPQTLRFNSIVELYKKHELGKAILGFTIPVSSGLLAQNRESSPLVVSLVVVSLCFGFAFIWNGLLLKEVLEEVATRMEQFGVALVAAAFCGLVSTLLPPFLMWVPWACWALFLVSFFITFFLSTGDLGLEEGEEKGNE